MKIEILDGHDGFDRQVEGTVELDNGFKYDFELDTYDGFTSIHLILDEEFNLEDEDDCEEIGFKEDERIELYDEILDFVNDNGYSFIGEEFE